MAYQNVGTPRFIIDWLQWYRSLGFINGGWLYNVTAHTPTSGGTDAINRVIGLNPSSQTTVIAFDASANTGFNYNINTREVAFPIHDIKIVGLLGHNFGNYSGANVWWQYNVPGSWKHLNLTDDILINSGGGEHNMTCEYSGFSLRSSNGTSSELGATIGDDSIICVIREIDPDDPEYSNIKLGSLLMGSYYEMPHSPDLSLTMTIEMDGVKSIRTKGGNDLVNRKYTKPAMWGDLAAWELDDGHGIDQKLARTGRRLWDLSFTHLQDGEIFPDLSNVNWQGGYYEDYEASGNTLLDDDTFYSQVIHKTNGGKLPFIFQPDKNYNNPDGFAICKFDMNSFEFKQVANGVYDCKMKIREVW